jgi:hypothetical protein
MITKRRAAAVVALALLAGAATGLAGCGGSSRPPEIPFHIERPAAAYFDAQICSILDAAGGGAHIKGQDGGTTNVIDGRSYWTFGDTIRFDGGLLPNNIGYSDNAGVNPDACIPITRKTDAAGVALPLLAKRDDELTVWPAAGQVSVQPGVVHFLFNSIANADYRTGTYELERIGLGRFDTDHLESTRVIDNLIDAGTFTGPASSLMGATGMLVSGGYVYIYFAADWNVRVGRVPAPSIEDKAAYTYWDGAAWVADVSKSVDILRTQGGQQAFNVAFNPYLGKWTALYTTNTLSAIAIAYADAPEGPFTDETVLLDCKAIFRSPGPWRARRLVFPQIQHSYICYHATQHPEFDKNERQTLYLTYSNMATYTLWLHRIVLAPPFAQWDSVTGRTVYARSGQDVPGATRRGVAFYAPTEPGDKLSPIHDWYDAAGDVHRYEAESPGAAYTDRGIAFYAATAAAPGLSPVTRWESKKDAGRIVYSTFDLSKQGYRSAAIAFYAATLDGQTTFTADHGYVYWIRERGKHDFGCCDQTNNPTRQTDDKQHEFTLGVDPAPGGYEGVVCSPVCGTGGKIVWSGPVTFTPNARGGKLTLTPDGPKGAR